MSRRSLLAQRREALLARSATQRARLYVQGSDLRESLMPSHMASSVLATVRQNKWLIAGAGMALIFIKPSRLMTGLKAGLIGWQAWRNAIPAIRSVVPALRSLMSWRKQD